MNTREIEEREFLDTLEKYKKGEFRLNDVRVKFGFPLIKDPRLTTVHDLSDENLIKIDLGLIIAMALISFVLGFAFSLTVVFNHIKA